MRFEAVTIKDIAKALGLSTSTVSRALRDSYQISVETKRIVLEYAKKLNYQPNPIALSLKERKTNTIGVIVCEIANSFFSQVINGIESVANKNGYNVLMSQSHESFEKEIRNLNYLSSRSIDGLIISVSVETNNFDLLNDLYNRGLPIVFFDRIVNEINTHKVTVDNYKGAYDATTHLLKNGYKNIAAIANVDFLSISKERVAGYNAALNDYAIIPNKNLLYCCEKGLDIHENVEAAITKFYKQPKKPDAIICLSDRLTTECLRTLNLKKILVPQDVALIGFSNSDLTSLIGPPLSVVKQPAFEMGEVAMQMLLQQINSKRPLSEFTTQVLKPELIIRESSAKSNLKKRK